MNEEVERRRGWTGEHTAEVVWTGERTETVASGERAWFPGLAQTQTTRQRLKQLHNEVQVLAELQHKKLVRLMMLVYEHKKNGSLDNFLFGTFL